MTIVQRIRQQFTIRKLAYRYRQLRNAVVDARILWKAGIGEEIAF